jgi:hypothetical protein
MRTLPKQAFGSRTATYDDIFSGTLLCPRLTMIIAKQRRTRSTGNQEFERLLLARKQSYVPAATMRIEKPPLGDAE